MLGYLYIPDINAILPIFEGDGEAVLQQGIGHVRDKNAKTTFPFLGKGHNCLLAGHSGLSTAKLFTDLNNLSVGATFYIRSNKKYYEYKVRDRIVKKPSAAKKCIPYSIKKDYCTLITCTPVPFNTHRLLLIGERIRYDGVFNNQNVKEHLRNINFVSIVFCSGVMVVLLVISVIVKKVRKNER